MTAAAVRALACAWCGAQPAADDLYGFELLQSVTEEGVHGWECIDSDACRARFDQLNGNGPQLATEEEANAGWVQLPGGSWIEECNLADVFGPASSRTGFEAAPGCVWE